MIPKLTTEQRDALRTNDGPVQVEDEQTHQVYLLVHPSTLEALQQNADRESIRQGIADLESGRVLTLDELDSRVRARLGLSRLRRGSSVADSHGVAADISP